MRGLLTSPIGLLIGISIGALGGGGSILAIPALVYAAGQDPRQATTTSLLIVGIAALVGIASHWRAGRVRVGAGMLFGLVGIGGSLLGSHLNRSVDPNVLLLTFSGVMVLAAWRMWSSNRRTPAGVEPGATGGATLVTTRTTVWTAAVAAKVAVAGSVVGFLTGFFGVGGGFVIVPALVLALGFDMPDAVGTSLLVIALNAGVALSSRLATSEIDWNVALPFTVASIAGVQIGTRLADRLPAATLVRSFVGLLVGVAVYTARAVGCRDLRSQAGRRPPRPCPRTGAMAPGRLAVVEGPGVARRAGCGWHSAAKRRTRPLAPRRVRSRSAIEDQLQR